MSDFDRARGALHLKIVYAGPARAGKSTSLGIVARAAARHGRAETAVSRGEAPGLLEQLTLRLGRAFGPHSAFAHLEVLPSGAALEPTQRALLRAADAIVFVGDASPGRAGDNAAALEALDEELRREGRDLWALPLVFQWNKRDLTGGPPPSGPDSISRGRPVIETLAVRGDGVVTALQRVCLPALRRAGQEHGLLPRPAGAEAGFSSAPAPDPDDRPTRGLARLIDAARGLLRAGRQAA
jgi:hypothetical protein